MNYQDSVWVNRKFFFILAGIFLLLIASTGTLGYMQFFSSQETTEKSVMGEMSKDVSKLNEDEILKVVGAMILLPDERPTFASVSDTQKLKGKELFANAKTGDIVMIFQKAQKIVIFRPTTSQIIEVAKIDLRSAAIPIIPSAAPTTTPTPTAIINSISPTAAQAASSSSGLQ